MWDIHSNPYLILACIAMVEREGRGRTHWLEVATERGGATASIRMFSNVLLTSALLLSVEGEGEMKRKQQGKQTHSSKAAQNSELP